MDTSNTTTRPALLYAQRGGRWGERIVRVQDTGARRPLVVNGTTATLALVRVPGERDARWVDVVRFNPEHWGGAVDPAEELEAARTILGRMREEALAPESLPTEALVAQESAADPRGHCTGPVRGEPRGDELGSMAPLYSPGDG